MRTLTQHIIHCVQKKTPTYVFDYNSGVSWSIFILFALLEREMNSLQFTYLLSWWRHNCVTLHATKVYFIELLLNIKYIEFELSLKIKSWSKTCENVKDFTPEDWQKILYKKN